MNLENITINTHSSICIKGSRTLYFDPFEIVDENHDADFIFVTHEHYDHFDPASISKLTKDETVIVAPESMKKKLLKELAIAEDKCIFCQPYEKHELNCICVEPVPAYNKLKPFHTKGSKWLGYVVKMDDTTYYVAGDTDVNDDVKRVQCDVALIPIGGLYTMDKKQGAELICNMKPKAAVPTHYGKIVGSLEDGVDFKNLVESADNNIAVELKL